ncbi:hypothetical protein G3O00_39390 [Burkholderia sp. Ac-20384]|uniref:hypothetical protein n=1 Tax=Burkholderia sp. Ac-20384 TaxID=2703902 RepID=UPI001980DC01|nr:hypothetical protein [Burkholderia sp. Ac-20384]MBN3829610.1 hypothetical protein [Burkholderia sp. Ac-20384]
MEKSAAISTSLNPAGMKTRTLTFAPLEQRVADTSYTTTLRPRRRLNTCPHRAREEDAGSSLCDRSENKRDSARSKNLRVHCSRQLGLEFIAAALIDYHARHPEIAVQLRVGDGDSDLIQRDFDISIVSTLSLPTARFAPADLPDQLVRAEIAEDGLADLFQRHHLSVRYHPQRNVDAALTTFIAFFVGYVKRVHDRAPKYCPFPV